MKYDMVKGENVKKRNEEKETPRPMNESMTTPPHGGR
jgi:hypothetical protein